MQAQFTQLMATLYDSPGEGRTLLGHVEHKLWILSEDTRANGTNASIYYSKEELRTGWLEKLAEPEEDEVVPEDVESAEWLDFVETHTREGNMDTFNYDCVALKVPVYIDTPCKL
jgi:hypothetical protein